LTGIVLDAKAIEELLELGREHHQQLMALRRDLKRAEDRVRSAEEGKWRGRVAAVMFGFVLSVVSSRVAEMEPVREVWTSVTSFLGVVFFSGIAVSIGEKTFTIPYSLFPFFALALFILTKLIDVVDGKLMDFQIRKHDPVIGGQSHAQAVVPDEGELETASDRSDENRPTEEMIPDVAAIQRILADAERRAALV
jgi:hypothetical protein